MTQPINGRLLVQVTDSQYKHVKLSSDKQHQLATSTGVVLSVAPDLETIIRGALKLGADQWVEGLPKPAELVGKTIGWEKYAEQNSLFDMENPSKLGDKIKVALIEYKDITNYAG
jgi:hypothetical protein